MRTAAAIRIGAISESPSLRSLQRRFANRPYDLPHPVEVLSSGTRRPASRGIMSLCKSPELTPELLAAAGAGTGGPYVPRPAGSRGIAAPSPAGDGRRHVRLPSRRHKQQKIGEQSGNVYENKGPLWKTRAEAGML
jgi:hypothetical protein